MIRNITILLLLSLLTPSWGQDCDCDNGVEMDCTGVCGGTAEEDACGVCGGIGPPDNYNCNLECIAGIDCNGECGGGAAEDACGICDGDITEVPDCGSGCTATGENLNQYGLDCNGGCGGSAVEDECGVCAGNGSPENYNCDGDCTAGVDCNGLCGGSAVVDECGICGDENNNYSGCTNPSACNYDETATIDDGSCEYEVDCAGECGGSIVEDECGICDGDGSSCRAIGYLDRGEVQISVPNYGSITGWDNFPSGLWNGYTYIPSLSFMIGIPGKDENGNPYEWAMKPHPQNPDTLVYWGPTVSESYFDRTPNLILTDWKAVENANGTNFSGDVFVEDIYPPYNYIDEGMYALANSDYLTTWPLDNYDSPFWPGWNDVDEEIYDQNIYLELDDRLADRDVDVTQGYPIGIKTQIVVSADGSEYFDDAIIYQLKLINQSGYDYKDLHFGIYLDIDNASKDENGSMFVHTPADDMFGLHEEADLVYVYDYDGNTWGPSDPAYVGVMFVNTPEDIGLTGFRWFDWYGRPGVGSNSMGGNGEIPVALDKEAIQYALLANQIDYPNQNFSDWEWRGIESGPNPRADQYNSRYFHTIDPETDLDSDQDPNFDSIDGIYETSYFNQNANGMDCIAFLSSGPYDLGVGDSIDLSFAIVFGEDEGDLINNAQQINSTSPIIGDVNQDGAVNILDLVLMANLILADDYIELADINNDGELNILDIVNVVNIILNN